METIVEKNKLKNYHWYLLSGSLCFCIVSMLFFEIIPVGNGLGWDGTVYYNASIDFEQKFLNRQMTSYFFQRSFPAMLTYYLLKSVTYFVSILGLSTANIYTPSSVLSCFFLWNTIAILGSNCFLFKIYNKFEFDKKVQIVCFLLFNLNYPVAKFFSYYPLLTDYLAFFMALAIFYAYLYGRQVLLFFLFLIGCFIFPTLFIVSAILFVFPYRASEANIFAHIYTKYVSKYIGILYILVTLLALAYFIFKTRAILIDYENSNYTLPLGQSPIDVLLFPLSVLLACAYIVCLVYFAYQKKILPKLLGNFRFFNLLLVTFCYISISLIIKSYFTEAGFTIYGFRNNIIIQSIKQPLVFYFCHFFYLGLSVILPFIYYKKWEEIEKKMGIGSMFVIIVHFLLMIGSETRQFITILPFMVVYSGLLLKLFFTVDNKVILVIGFLSFFISTVWLPINISHVINREGMPYLYAIHQGPWMPANFYYIIAPFCIVVTLFLAYFLKTKKKSLSL